ncbi:MAG: MarR family transcriptional regulator [Alphaproteobacteria bacterium]|nr:MarR family transcriptional regulator [Alphaproteobacteria bacterium]
MIRPRRATTAPDAGITELIVETFRLNGRLLAAGDALVAGIGLTSARWQVLGAIAASPAALPVAHLARNMGLSRQAVQRLANEMEAEGLLVFEDNPHHERAKLVRMTGRGRTVFDAAMKRQRPWAAALATDLSPTDVARTIAVLRVLRERLEVAP